MPYSGPIYVCGNKTKSENLTSLIMAPNCRIEIDYSWTKRWLYLFKGTRYSGISKLNTLESDLPFIVEF